MMKHILAASLLAIAFTPAQAQSNKPVRMVLGFGVTGGGDKLDSVDYTNGDTDNLKAGGGLQILGGVDWRVNQQVSLQANLGVHVHLTRQASNGDANFMRFPLELLAYYHPNEQWRIGGGARLVSSPKVNGSGEAYYLDRDFKNTTGAVLEVEYFYQPGLSLKLRATQEEYEAKDWGRTRYSGNHVGVFGNFYF